MLPFEKARKELEEYVRSYAPRHHATPYAPDSWRTLKAWRDTDGNKLFVDSLPVYDGGNDNTIYVTSLGNYAFRALHDATHLELNAPFNLDGERIVARDQYRHAIHHGVSKDAARLLYLDIVVQSIFYTLHKQYVGNQRLLIEKAYSARERAPKRKRSILDMPCGEYGCGCA